MIERRIRISPPFLLPRNAAAHITITKLTMMATPTTAHAMSKTRCTKIRRLWLTRIFNPFRSQAHVLKKLGTSQVLNVKEID